MSNLPDYLKPKEVADKLRVEEDTILRWAAPLSDEEKAAGSTRVVMPSYKYGGRRLFRADEVMDWLAGKAEGERAGLAEVRTLREAG